MSPARRRPAAGWRPRHARIFEIVEQLAEQAGDRVVLRDPNRTFTGRELHFEVVQLAVNLARLGLRRGMRVVLVGENGAALACSLFAASFHAAWAVPVNARLTAAEIDAIVDHADPAFVLFCTDTSPEAAAHARHFGADAVELGRFGIQLLDRGVSAAEPVSSDPREQVAVLMYTSGTTGRPKGAVLTQKALFWNAVNSAHMHDLTARDRVLTVLPMFHVGGLNIQTTPALHLGAEVVLLERFDPEATLRAVAEHRPTLTVLVPATMRALIEHPAWEQTDLSSLRMIACGSQVVPMPLLDAFNRRGVPAAQVYGATETCPIAVYQRAEEALRKPGSTGRPGLHVEMRIVDREGRDLPPGERGEVWIRGPNVTTGYWRDPEATRAALVDGWFRTGDVGVVDDEGDLWIVDRFKDVVISGGENIYPAELEAVLHAEPRIREAVVVGRPDPRWGEVPVAVVVRADPALREEEVLALFEGRLARFKHPRAVLFVDGLPKNAMGKVLKYRLRAWLAGEGDGIGTGS